jgi:hypothetical protein
VCCGNAAWLTARAARALVEDMTQHDWRQRATIAGALAGDWIAGDRATLETLYRERALG